MGKVTKRGDSADEEEGLTRAEGWLIGALIAALVCAQGAPAADNAGAVVVEPGDQAAQAQGGAEGTASGALPSNIDPKTGEHPVYHLRPEPFSDSEAQLVTLDDLLAMALAHNLGLNQQRYGVEKGHFAVDQTYYAFDAQLAGAFGYSRRTGGTTTGGASSASDSYTANVKWTKPREFGDAFQFSYDLSRSHYPAALAGAGDTYGAGYTLGYTRPLARGAGKYLNRIPRFAASNNLVLSYARLDDQVRKLKQSLINTYYQAVAAREGISVRQTSLETSLQQLERAVERYKVGLAIQADVLQAENSVLSQRSQLLTAESAYSALLDQLTTLCGLPQEFALKVESADALEEPGAELPEDLWTLVEQNSYDLKSLCTQLANLRLTRQQQLNNLKPSIDLSASYGRSGEDTTLGKAVAGNENQSYQVGLNWSRTPGERNTRASVAQTDLDLASLDLAIQDTELQLKAALRGVERDLETKRQQVDLAKSNLDVLDQTHTILAERQAVGLATTLDVVEAQDKLLAGQLALLQARVDLAEAYRQILLLAGLI